MTKGENAAIALVSFRIETILIDILFHIYFTFSELFYVVWYFCIFYKVILFQKHVSVVGTVTLVAIKTRAATRNVL